MPTATRVTGVEGGTQNQSEPIPPVSVFFLTSFSVFWKMSKEEIPLGPFLRWVSIAALNSEMEPLTSTRVADLRIDSEAFKGSKCYPGVDGPLGGEHRNFSGLSLVICFALLCTVLEFLWDTMALIAGACRTRSCLSRGYADVQSTLHLAPLFLLTRQRRLLSHLKHSWRIILLCTWTLSIQTLPLVAPLSSFLSPHISGVNGTPAEQLRRHAIIFRPGKSPTQQVQICQVVCS